MGGGAAAKRKKGKKKKKGKAAKPSGADSVEGEAQHGQGLTKEEEGKVGAGSLWELQEVDGADGEVKAASAERLVVSVRKEGTAAGAQGAGESAAVVDKASKAAGAAGVGGPAAEVDKASKAAGAAGAAGTTACLDAGTKAVRASAGSLGVEGASVTTNSSHCQGAFAEGVTTAGAAGETGAAAAAAGETGAAGAAGAAQVASGTSVAEGRSAELERVLATAAAAS